uniref:Acyl-CoA thioesterase n=1 Tax=Haemonchus placei TaxID=6290 RepID=A0A0N4X8C2_HAEPC
LFQQLIDKHITFGKRIISKKVPLLIKTNIFACFKHRSCWLFPRDTIDSTRNNQAWQRGEGWYHLPKLRSNSIDCFTHVNQIYCQFAVAQGTICNCVSIIQYILPNLRNLSDIRIFQTELVHFSL